MKRSTTDSDRDRRYDRVVGTFHRDMYRYAVWLCRDKAIAEDIVQEALLRAWRSLDNLREDGVAKPWLLTIVRRENARHFARKRLETVDIDNLSTSQSAILAKTDNSDIDSIRQAIFELEDDYREPLVLQVLIGHSIQEIAEIMELSSTAVLTRLHRARKQLKAKICESSPS
jgi:RNA polymerase sigma-70 factor (ECF subfamily)